MPKEKIEDSLKLRSEEVQEILSNPPAWIVRWGISFIFIFMIVILTLSFIIRYPDFVSGKVLVTTKSPTEQVVARYSEALERLNVKNGDTVSAGQPLAIIRNNASIEDVYLLKQVLDTLKDNADSFLFPIEFFSHSSLGDLGLAYVNFEKSYVNYHLFKDLKPFENQIAGDRISLNEIRTRLKDQIVQKELLEEEIQLGKTDFERYETLYKKGVISQQQFDKKKGELLLIKKNSSATAISISQMREAISSASRTLRGSRINRQEEETRMTANLFQSYNELKRALRTWQQDYQLSASIEGRVSFQGIIGENQFVNYGDVIFTVLPLDTDTLVGKLILPAINMGKVTIGQKVLVKLDNFPHQEFGMLVGKVSNISVSPDQDNNYYIYIALPNGTETSYQKSLSFEQELIGNAEIITEDLSVAQRIFYKIKDVFKYE